MSTDSRADLRENMDHYEQQLGGLGRRFLQHYVNAIDTVVERPMSFPQAHATIRRARLAKFPYGIFFRIVGANIRVIAVMDLARDPRSWGKSPVVSRNLVQFLRTFKTLLEAPGMMLV